MKLLIIFVALVASAFATQYGNPEEQNDPHLFEGDIVMSPGNRNGILNAKRWPNGIIPFTIDSNTFTSSEITKIKAAHAEYAAKTCLRWVARTNQASYVRIGRINTGCWSYVGKLYTSKEQRLNLGRGCFSKGTILHEMMHAAGFWHEQSRYDRNSYVRIALENVRSGMEHNFNIHSSSSSQLLGSPYNYGSVMHYSSRAFSKNGRDTIVSLKPGVTMGQRAGFHWIDAYKLNKLYGCTDKLVTIPAVWMTTPGGGGVVSQATTTQRPTTGSLPFRCDFESSNICGFYHDRSSKVQFQWRRQRGSTPSSSTGPSVDHTKGTSLGYYMYTEASGRRQGDVANLWAKISNTPKTVCLEFWLHMYGSSMGSIKILRSAGGRYTAPWIYSGEKGNRWLRGRVTLTNADTIGFQGVIGSSYRSDMAIDDVKVTEGACQ